MSFQNDSLAFRSTLMERAESGIVEKSRMSAEVECVIWCPRCRAEKFEIRRVPTGSEGVFVHKSYPEGRNEKVCECGCLLERKK